MALSADKQPSGRQEADNSSDSAWLCGVGWNQSKARARRRAVAALMSLQMEDTGEAR